MAATLLMVVGDLKHLRPDWSSSGRQCSVGPVRPVRSVLWCGRQQAVVRGALIVLLMVTFANDHCNLSRSLSVAGGPGSRCRSVQISADQCRSNAVHLQCRWCCFIDVVFALLLDCICSFVASMVFRCICFFVSAFCRYPFVDLSSYILQSCASTPEASGSCGWRLQKNPDRCHFSSHSSARLVNRKQWNCC